MEGGGSGQCRGTEEGGRVQIVSYSCHNVQYSKRSMYIWFLPVSCSAAVDVGI
jgi:hypothetical protein